MTAADNGRFCKSCSKTVIDFAGMSNQQIIDYLSVNQHSCGKFNSNQIEQINRDLGKCEKQRVPFFKQAIVFASLLFTTGYVKAQSVITKHQTEQAPTKPALIGEVTIKQDTIKYRKFTGKIIDADNKQPIVGATIRVDGTTIAAISNNEGVYSIKIPANTKNFNISSIGYKSQVVCANTTSATELSSVISTLEPAILGGVVTVQKAPFYKRWYYRFIKRPIEKIFR